MRSETKLKSGVTLTELCVITAMILVLTTLSLPSLYRVLDNARLKAAAGQLASFYEQARIRSAQDNTYYELLLSAPGVKPSQVCLDLNGDAICAADEPQAQLSLGVSTADSSAVPAPLDSSILGFSPLTTATSTMFDQQNKSVPGLAWNGRGLPCQRVSPTSACTPVGGWVQYLKLSRSATDAAYAAVAIGPTGRIKVWMYDGSRSWF